MMESTSKIQPDNPDTIYDDLKLRLEKLTDSELEDWLKESQTKLQEYNQILESSTRKVSHMRSSNLSDSDRGVVYSFKNVPFKLASFNHTGTEKKISNSKS
jgi:DNA phosphorothioation-dependent restriction protein DptG